MRLRLSISVLLAVLAWGPALAFTARQLTPAIDAMVDGQLGYRDIVAACAPAPARETLPARWEEARNTLAALLWVAGFEPAYVRGVLARTDATALAKASTAKPNCNDPTIAGMAKEIDPGKWAEDYRSLFKEAGISVAMPLPTDKRLAKVKAAFAREVPLQTVMLSCVALLDGRAAAFMTVDWLKLLDKVGAVLIEHGYPRDEVITLIGSAQPDRLLSHPADRAAAGAACQKDKSWQDRWARFEYAALQSAVTDIVSGKP